MIGTLRLAVKSCWRTHRRGASPDDTFLHCGARARPCVRGQRGRRGHPSLYTFVSTAMRFLVERGCALSTSKSTPSISTSHFWRKKISEPPKVIAPVHYAGVGCEMDAVDDGGEPASVRVIEDTAQA